MEFLKRKHFSLWITLFVTCLLDVGYGLQGVPTWLCLGIKSPFIEFKNEIEILANTSISLNITKDEQVLMHEESLKKLGTFIKPIDLRNSTTGYVKSNLTKKLPPVPLGRRKGVTENPIVEEMDRKDIELLEDETDPNSGFPGLSNDDRKFIVPMALKNPTSEPKIEPKTPAPPSSSNDFSTNIDDLKNHILMLQNMTKNDKSFQSKFVVFPSIQRERNGTQIKSQTFTSTSSPVKRVRYTTPKIPEPAKSKVVDYDEHSEDYHKEISIIPQVLLLNDQTPPDEDDVQQVRDDNQKETRVMYSRRRNFRKTSTAAIMTAATTAATSVEKSRRNSRRPGGGGADASERRNRKRQQNCKNLDTPRCQRQRRRQLALSLNINKTMHMTSGDKPNPADPSKKTSSHPDLDQFWSGADVSHDEQKLSRSVRSHHNRRNAGGMRSGLTSIYEGSQASRDFIIPVGSVINNNQSSAYKEAIDLNPDLCYKVDGMTYGQQKLCVLHTGMMPAISRGARAAIQECQHQFRNRRWNCSTTEDNTVFGPVSSLGSPEMAFIHALAAATVTSFIARSCRDGQLPVCGCSRGARPKQLHDDWTWGGCGDDLEFAYKFAQDFIDIRERERKRGTRGLVSVPPKTKIEEKLLAETSSDGDGSTNSTSLSSVQDRLNNKTVSSAQSADENLSPFKPEDLLELQEKITKEILNSKLQEKEMLELQEKINREILNSKVFNLEHHAVIYGKKQHQRGGLGHSFGLPRMKNGVSAKSRSMMNIHNNEAGRRAVIKKTRITCKCHGVSGSCSLITCWQQLSSIREIGDYLREKYDAATQVKLNKRGRLQVRDPRYKIPTPHDLVYLDESPDWCRYNRQLQWPGTHGRVCNKTSSGLDGCAILCCGRGYNTKTVIVRERCNCKFHWCCQVKCDVCVKVLEEHTCK